MSPDDAESFDPAAAARALQALEGGAGPWQAATPRQRARRLRGLRKLIATRACEIAECIAGATLRPAFEVLTQEVIPVLEMARYCERRMPGWLRPRRTRYLRPGFLGTGEWLAWESLGTVAVVTPANFPFSLALMSAIYLALAGNSVVLKPSERVTEVSALLVELLGQAGLAPDVVGVVEGGPAAARWLASSPAIAKLFFFGTRAAGYELAGLCGAAAKPFVLELGGGTTAIVLADADLGRAAAGIAWSAFYARGESCVSTERVYVEATVWEPFLACLAASVPRIWCESRSDLTIREPMARLVRAALAGGARYLATPAGVPVGSGAVSPGVLVDVDPLSPLLAQELFAPLLVACRVGSAEEAVERANAGCRMLAGSVWSRRRSRARALAGRLDASMVWVNDASFGLPNLPWGGRGESGWGAIFSRHALAEAARVKWIMISPAHGRRPWWPPYSSWKLRLARALTRVYRW